MGIHDLIQAPTKAITRLLLSFHEANGTPDIVLRRAMRTSLSAWLNECYKPSFQAQISDLLNFAHSLESMPISPVTDEANSQQYELPTEFFELILGKHLKYSCNYFVDDSSTLDDAEKAMLKLYCERAQIKDGHTILDLGCGCGSLCLYIAQNYKNCKITGISYSKTEKAYVDQLCRDKMLDNVDIVFADISTYETEATFNRIFAVELLEDMRNYKALLKEISKWMKEDGLLFVHHCGHKAFSYYFEETNKETNISLSETNAREWVGRYFFTGGTLPSANTLLYFQEDVSVIGHWIVNGNHFARTCKEWLKKMDKNIGDIKPIMQKIYGDDSTVKWTAYWRSFFLFLEEMYGYHYGEEWMITHLLFKKK